MPKYKLLKDLFRAYVRLLRNPNSTRSVTHLVDAMHGVGLFKFTRRHLLKNPVTRNTLQEKPLLPVVEPQSLLKYPVGSLGYELGLLLTSHGYDGNYFRTRSSENIDDERYILIRVGETHDFWHLVTGFDTDLSGELGIQAFMLRQLRTPQSIFIVTGGLIRILATDPKNFSTTFKSVQRGFHLAKIYPPLFSYDWLYNLDKPLKEITGQLLGHDLTPHRRRWRGNDPTRRLRPTFAASFQKSESASGTTYSVRIAGPNFYSPPRMSPE